MLLRPFTTVLRPPTTATSSSPPLLPHLIKPIHQNPNKTPFTKLTLTQTNCTNSTTTLNNGNSYDFEFQNPECKNDIETDSPWEGAVTYKRNAAVTHLEYCTTLERLGLGKLSSNVSKETASRMGLRIVKTAGKGGDEEIGTPVLVSVEVVRKKQKLRLDGIVRTVIALNCNRCGEPASQSVYSNLSILLCEEPIEEPETINLGVMFGEDKSQNFGDGDDEDSLIDLDDQLYFPVDQRSIDISKNIRDLIHIEITLTAVCDPNCKGLCLKCGTNLNNSKCTCRTHKVKEKSYGPLGNLKEKMQQS